MSSGDVVLQEWQAGMNRPCHSENRHRLVSAHLVCVIVLTGCWPLAGQQDAGLRKAIQETLYRIEPAGNGYSMKNPDITGGGVDVSDSNLATFSSNLIYENYPGFAFHLSFQQKHPNMTLNKCLGAKNQNDTSNSLKNNQVLGNAIYSCSGDTAIGKVWGPGGTLNSRGNQYRSNHYHLSDATSDWFSDATNTNDYVPQDWSQWKQGNHDTQGSLSVGCKHQ